MRVLHLLKTSVGASWALRQTAELVKQGIEVHLALPDGPMVAKYRSAGVTVHILDPALRLPNVWDNVAAVKDLRALIKRINPDLVHSHFVATTLLMRLAMVGMDIPRIFHIPGPLHLEHFLYRNLDIKTAGKWDYYLASCKWTEHALARFGIAQEKIGLAYYGVNESDFTQAATNQCNLRQELGLDNETYLLAMVAYFYAPKRFLGQQRGLKGHEDLIDALAIVRQTYPNIHCVMVGGPWGNAQQYFEQVKRYANKKVGDVCSFLGTRSDVPALYPQIDLAVHPSHSENVGGAVESMYARVITLTSNVGGFPDLVVPGETGYMARSKDPESLAQQILQAISERHLHSQMRQRAFDKVSQVMNVQDNAVQVSEFYRHVLAQQEVCVEATN